MDRGASDRGACGWGGVSCPRAGGCAGVGAPPRPPTWGARAGQWGERERGRSEGEDDGRAASRLRVTSLALGEAALTTAGWRRQWGRGGRAPIQFAWKRCGQQGKREEKKKDQRGRTGVLGGSRLSHTAGLAAAGPRPSGQCPETVSPMGPLCAGYVSAPCGRARRCWCQKDQTPPPDAAVAPGRGPRPPPIPPPAASCRARYILGPERDLTDAPAHQRLPPRTVACNRVSVRGRGRRSGAGGGHSRPLSVYVRAPGIPTPGGAVRVPARPPSVGRTTPAHLRAGASSTAPAWNLCRGRARICGEWPSLAPFSEGALCYGGCTIPLGPHPSLAQSPPVPRVCTTSAPHLFCPERSQTAASANSRCAGRHIFPLHEQPGLWWCRLSDEGADTGGGELTVQQQGSGQSRRPRSTVCGGGGHLRAAAHDPICIEWPPRTARKV